MKKLCVILGFLGLFAFTCGAQVGAQMQAVPPPVRGNPMARSHGGGGYNPATVEVLNGQVVTVNRRAPKKAGKQALISFVLKTEQEAVTVNVGPAAYVDQQNFALASGDVVQVTGSRVTRPRRVVIIAGEIRKGNQVLRLRDDRGRPLWSGMKRRGGF